MWNSLQELQYKIPSIFVILRDFCSKQRNRSGRWGGRLSYREIVHIKWKMRFTYLRKVITINYAT